VIQDSSPVFLSGILDCWKRMGIKESRVNCIRYKIQGKLLETMCTITSRNDRQGNNLEAKLIGLYNGEKK
jgi:hypothetical protein